jgi:hypothetical protein
MTYHDQALMLDRIHLILLSSEHHTKRLKNLEHRHVIKRTYMDWYSTTTGLLIPKDGKSKSIWIRATQFVVAPHKPEFPNSRAVRIRLGIPLGGPHTRWLVLLSIGYGLGATTRRPTFEKGKTHPPRAFSRLHVSRAERVPGKRRESFSGFAFFPLRSGRPVNNMRTR